MAELWLVEKGIQGIVLEQKKKKGKIKKNLREERFPYEYVIDLNGQKAAERCGVAKAGARVWASRTLSKPNVQAKIKELQEKKNQTALMSAEEADRRLTWLARVNFKDLVDNEDNARPMSELTEEQAYCLKEVTFIETQLGTHRKVKVTDPHAALRTVFERRGMLKQVQEVVTESYPDRIKRLEKESKEASEK